MYQRQKLPTDRMPHEWKSRQGQGELLRLQSESMRSIKDMDKRMHGEVVVGDDRTFVVAGYQVDRDTPVSNLFKRIKSNHDKPGRHLAAEKKISAVHDAIDLALQCRLQGPYKVGKKFRSSSAPLDTRAERKIKTQMGIG